MNNKHRKTLKSIFTNPVSSSIQWKDIEKLLIAVGCVVSEGRGSRVRFKKNNIFAIFHRPHPEKETDKGAVLSVRDYLIKIGEMP
jgi:predicted RNA binding protein YcfA (HicA-like mRNA interferase family)